MPRARPGAGAGGQSRLCGAGPGAGAWETLRPERTVRKGLRGAAGLSRSREARRGRWHRAARAVGRCPHQRDRPPLTRADESRSRGRSGSRPTRQAPAADGVGPAGGPAGSRPAGTPAGSGPGRGREGKRSPPSLRLVLVTALSHDQALSAGASAPRRGCVGRLETLEPTPTPLASGLVTCRTKRGGLRGFLGPGGAGGEEGAGWGAVEWGCSPHPREGRGWGSKLGRHKGQLISRGAHLGRQGQGSAPPKSPPSPRWRQTPPGPPCCPAHLLCGEGSASPLGNVLTGGPSHRRQNFPRKARDSQTRGVCVSHCPLYSKWGRCQQIVIGCGGGVPASQSGARPCQAYSGRRLQGSGPVSVAAGGGTVLPEGWPPVCGLGGPPASGFLKLVSPHQWPRGAEGDHQGGPLPGQPACPV